MRCSIVCFSALTPVLFAANTTIAATYEPSPIEEHIRDADLIVIGNPGDSFLEEIPNGDRGGPHPLDSRTAELRWTP